MKETQVMQKINALVKDTITEGRRISSEGDTGTALKRSCCEVYSGTAVRRICSEG
jgi:hypothetical protein